MFFPVNLSPHVTVPGRHHDLHGTPNASRTRPRRHQHATDPSNIRSHHQHLDELLLPRCFLAFVGQKLQFLNKSTVFGPSNSVFEPSTLTNCCSQTAAPIITKFFFQAIQAFDQLHLQLQRSEATRRGKFPQSYFFQKNDYQLHFIEWREADLRGS